LILIPPRLDRRALPWLALLAAAVSAVLFARARTLSIPLERDEGEYAYMGQLMLEGVPPYKLAYNMKLPGTYATYAAVMGAFGETDRGIHLGFLFVNLASIALMYVVARRILGTEGAATAATAFALLSASAGTLGLQAHATHLVTLFALAGIWLWQRAQATRREWSLFLSGLFFGAACICKQPGLFFGMFGAAVTLRAETNAWPSRWRKVAGRMAMFAAGWILPFVVTCLLIWRAGTFDRFWFWTWTYARAHAALLPPDMMLDGFLGFWSDAGAVRYALAAAAVGLICLTRQPDENDRRFFVLTLLGFSLPAFCAGFYFYRHYLIVMLPVASLLIAVAIETLKRSLATRRCWAIACFTALCAAFVCCNSALWFRLTPDAASRRLYQSDLFCAARDAARFIGQRAAPDATIAVFGSEPEIFFYAHRRSATGYIYMYDLVQLHRYAHGMQQEMIAQITNARPEYVVLVNVASSWWLWPGSETTAQDWGVDLVRRAYDVVGAAYLYPDHTDYAWHPSELKRRIDTRNILLICRRKSNA